MDSVVHFEMPYEDNKRMAEFYGKVFGWQTQVLGPEMGSYVTATTTQTDEKTMRPKNPGAINGGFYKKYEGSGTRVVIAVEDIHEAMKEVGEAGGKITGGSKPGEPDDIPGIGLYIAFEDTEGNKVALLQPKGM